MQELVDITPVELRTFLPEDVPVTVDEGIAIAATPSHAKVACDACGRSYRKLKQLRKHLRSNHSSETFHLIEAPVRH